MAQKEEKIIMQTHTQIIMHGVENKCTSMDLLESLGDGGVDKATTMVPQLSRGSCNTPRECFADGDVDKATEAPQFSRGLGDAGKATMVPRESSGDGDASKATVAPQLSRGSGDAGKATVAPQLSRGLGYAGKATVVPRESSGDVNVEKAKMGPRERLKRHRTEVAGNVWIPEMWGQETYLNDWIDCTAFDASLVNRNIMLARASLMRQPLAPPLNVASLPPLEHSC